MVMVAAEALGGGDLKVQRERKKQPTVYYGERDCRKISVLGRRVGGASLVCIVMRSGRGRRARWGTAVSCK
jgi:hypothetical protein